MAFLLWYKMVRNSMNYQNGKIYKVVNDIDDEIYVGSTTQTLAKRMAWHRGSCVMKAKMNRKVYQHMIKLGRDNFRIILLEEYPCNNRMELEQRERYFVENLKPSLNSIVPARTRTNKEYRRDNVEKIRVQKQKYYEENKNWILEHNKEYREKSKEKINTKHREYYAQKKETILAKQAEYYQTKREHVSERQKITYQCVCGVISRKCAKKRHERSQFHQQFISSHE
jgi:hypothetical protein